MQSCPQAKGRREQDSYHPLASVLLSPGLGEENNRLRHLSPLASCSLVPRLQSEGDLYCHLVSGSVSLC